MLTNTRSTSTSLDLRNNRLYIAWVAHFAGISKNAEGANDSDKTVIRILSVIIRDSQESCDLLQGPSMSQQTDSEELRDEEAEGYPMERRETDMSALQTPLLPSEETDNNPLDTTTSSFLRIEESSNTAKQCCGRVVLGTLYVGISIYMSIRLIARNVLSGGGLCHEASLCALFVSGTLMAAFLGLQGFYILCVRKYRSITIFLAPLAILLVYLMLAFAYLALRNYIKYGRNQDRNDDDARDDDDGIS